MIHTKTNYSRCGKHSILSNCPRSNPQSKMIPRIKSYKPMKDYQLLVAFDDGRIVKYDVMDDIRSIPAFKDLETVYGLFANAQLDSSRTCIYWNDQIDLPSDYQTLPSDAIVICSFWGLLRMPLLHLSLILKQQKLFLLNVFSKNNHQSITFWG